MSKTKTIKKVKKTKKKRKASDLELQSLAMLTTQLGMRRDLDSVKKEIRDLNFIKVVSWTQKPKWGWMLGSIATMALGALSFVGAFITNCAWSMPSVILGIIAFWAGIIIFIESLGYGRSVRWEAL